MKRFGQKNGSIFLRSFGCRKKEVNLQMQKNLFLFDFRFSEKCPIILNLGPMLWFLNIFMPKYLVTKLAIFTQITESFCKKLIITMVFEKNAIFCRKLAKIAKNCNHNNDPRSKCYDIYFRRFSSTYVHSSKIGRFS
jgi:hypothetical protein